MDDDEDDFGSDIDDAEFLAIATQAEQQLSSVTDNPLFQNAADNPDDFYSDGIEVEDEVEDEGVDDDTFVSRSRAPLTRGNLRQTTLFGSQVVDTTEPTSQQARRNWPLANSQSQELATHHKIDREAAKTWVYPINVSYRDYQFNVVRRALLSNVLCALPTGLGKTFIAATVMLNWFRWAPEGQIAFLAPTKPLVHQQIEACFHICGIPRSQTATMTGGVVKALRQEYWEERRVFFTTPQTMQNDIKNGLCDPKRIVCLVVDEAHRTTGAYAYGEVVKLVRQVNTSFRLLALTATPGSTVESVQGVIDALGISKVEIRTDESIDIRQYIQRRTLDVQVFPLSEVMVELRDLYCKCLEPMLKKLNAAKAFYQTRAEALTPFGVMTAMKEWMNSPLARNLNKGYYWSLAKIFKNLASLAHPLILLNTHGVRLFYDKLCNARDDASEETDVNKSSVNAIKKEPGYGELMKRAAAIVDDPNFSGHPKIDFMVGAILKHFSEAEDEETKKSTRIMVFTSFRDSAEEVTRLLRRHEPMIRPHVFVGQAHGKNSAGMSQKQQLEIIKKFSDGTYNTIVSTSIGEEGLDIGEVDLIVCYDTSASPIRLLQRMGRTGRKRVGGVLILLTEGREQDSYKRALDNYAVMQKKIASGNDFVFPHHLSPRIIPKEVNPQPDKQHIEIPVENTQAEPERKGPRVKRKAPPKKFFMPDGVKAGFTKASRIGKEGLSTDSGGESDEEHEGIHEEPLAPEINDDHTGLLTETEYADLVKNYKTDWDTMLGLELQAPNLQTFPEVQRNFTKARRPQHGWTTKNMVKMLRRMHTMTEDQVDYWKQIFDSDLLKERKKTTAFKPVRPTGAKPMVRSKTASLKETTVNSAVELDEDMMITSTRPATARINATLMKRANPISSELLKKPKVSKRRKQLSDYENGEEGIGNSDSEDLPDAKDLVSGFRWAGTGKRAG